MVSSAHHCLSIEHLKRAGKLFEAKVGLVYEAAPPALILCQPDKTGYFLELPSLLRRYRKNELFGDNTIEVSL
jgi:hypothetical protein